MSVGLIEIPKRDYQREVGGERIYLRKYKIFYNSWKIQSFTLGITMSSNQDTLNPH